MGWRKNVLYLYLHITKWLVVNGELSLNHTYSTNQTLQNPTWGSMAILCTSLKVGLVFAMNSTKQHKQIPISN